jgi:hypothetical protein
MGRQFEDRARKIYSIGDKVAFTLGDKTRIVDGFGGGFVTEVKNTVYQGYTAQIKDMMKIAATTGTQVRLIVRQNTRLSKELQKLTKEGKIKIERISSKTDKPNEITP